MFGRDCGNICSMPTDADPEDTGSSASVIHADLDAFYASVEQRDNPELRGKPVIVGMGVVLASSYEARSMGVRTAMNGVEARRLCPNAIVVSPRMSAYSEASKDVFEIFRDTTPNVEGISIDEAFMEVGGLRRSVGSPREIAETLRARVRSEVGLPLSVGIATTKFLAKVASAVGKPDGLLEVPPGTEIEFLHPLPVRRLWGVGKVTEAKLHARGIKTVGELAAIDRSVLMSWLGTANGRQTHALAHNLDPRKVVTGKRRASVGAQRALGRRHRTKAEAEVILLELVDRVTRRMRKGNRVCRTVMIRWRGHDMESHTMSSSVSYPTHSTARLLEEAKVLLDRSWPEIEKVGLGLLGFTAANLSDASEVQMGLDFSGRNQGEIDSTIDSIRNRFGNSALKRGSLLRHDPIEMPTLPDPGA
jgi:DNA polymerase-4